MNKVILKIGGMSCSACSSGLEKFLNKQNGIKNASVNLVLGQAFIEYDDFLEIENIEKFIEEAGYKSLGIYDETKEEKNNDNSKTYLFVFAILAIVVLYISMSHMIGLPVIPFLHMIKYPIHYATSLLILTIPFMIYGANIFKNGIKSLIFKAPTKAKKAQNEASSKY